MPAGAPGHQDFHGELEAALRRADVTPEPAPYSSPRRYDAPSRPADSSYSENTSRPADSASERPQNDYQAPASADTAAEERTRQVARETEPTTERATEEATEEAKGAADQQSDKSASAKSTDGDEKAGRSAQTENDKATEKSKAGAAEEASRDQSAGEESQKVVAGTRGEAEVKTAKKQVRLQESFAQAEAAQAGSAKKAKGDAGESGLGTQVNAASPDEGANTDLGKQIHKAGAGKDARAEAAATATEKTAQAVNKERGASLLAREIPREAPESSSAKDQRLRNDGQSEGGGKESGKGAGRATVILRGNSRGGDGGAHSSGGNNSGAQEGFRLLSEAGSREAVGVDTPRGEGFRLDAGGLDVSGRTANPGTSSLEGGRDVAPRHLQQQLKDFATGDVVRHARFVLKENAGGEIRLLLKPEQLGTVRVRLEVQDNRIAGRIIVENTTVRDAFEQTLSELQRAFREAGLETGSLEVTVGEDGQAAGQQTMTKGRKNQAIEELEASVPTIVGELEEHRMINVYA